MKEEHNRVLTNLDLGGRGFGDVEYGLVGECLQFVQQFWRVCSIIEMWETGRWEYEGGDSFVGTKTVLTLRWSVVWMVLVFWGGTISVYSIL